MHDEPTTITQLLHLESHGPDTWIGVGPRYEWGRVYGGQVVAQALRAAAHTVDDGFLVHSLHAYFIRGGDIDQPIRYEVDRLRDGRSFVTRQVVARQSGGAILSLSASFHVDEDGERAQPLEAPTVPGPDEGVDETWSPIFRHVEIDLGPRPARSQAWMRVVEELDDDPVLHACALAFVSDDNPMSSIAAASVDHPPPADGFDDVWMGASLDHSLWIHEPLRVDRWHLFDLQTQRLGGSRGLATGQVFDGDGLHVATVAQEGLLRRRRPR
ncbi:MAG: acyl-CoA thioesterase domain-containing protein [Actinomycetota bacterium]